MRVGGPQLQVAEAVVVLAAKVVDVPHVRHHGAMVRQVLGLKSKAERDKVKQSSARHRQRKVRQSKARQGETMQGEPRQGEARQGKARQEEVHREERSHDKALSTPSRSVLGRACVRRST